MFRKLVTSLSFSPSVIGELGTYNLRLKREQAQRGLGLFFLVLALIVQTLAVSFPPESANAANENDIVYGGIDSLEDLVAKYDKNDQNIRDIYTSLGITRAELLMLQPGTVRPAGQYYVAGRTSQISTELGEHTHSFHKEHGGQGTIYIAPTRQLDATAYSYAYKTYPALISNSVRTGAFAIITKSGNPVISSLPKSSQQTTPQCQDQNTTSTCKQPIIYTKSATNNSQNKIATNATAQASDRITYTIRAKNIGDKTVDVPFSDRLHDVLEYAEVVDTNGGTFDVATKTITWPDTPITAQETSSRSFSVRIKSHLPATAQGLGNPMSYDCIISNTNTNTISIDVACPAPKFIEAITTELPQSSVKTSLAAGTILLLLTLYFYARARQQREELRLIRKDINAGAI